MRDAYFIRYHGTITGPFRQAQVREWLALERLDRSAEFSVDKVNWVSVALLEQPVEPPADATKDATLWVYLDSSMEQQGPLTWSQLADLFRAGTIDAETPVRRKGQSNWISAGEAIGMAPPSPPQSRPRKQDEAEEERPRQSAAPTQPHHRDNEAGRHEPPAGSGWSACASSALLFIVATFLNLGAVVLMGLVFLTAASSAKGGRQLNETALEMLLLQAHVIQGASLVLEAIASGYGIATPERSGAAVLAIVLLVVACLESLLYLSLLVKNAGEGQFAGSVLNPTILLVATARLVLTHIYLRLAVTAAGGDGVARSLNGLLILFCVTAGIGLLAVILVVDSKNGRNEAAAFVSLGGLLVLDGLAFVAWRIWFLVTLFQARSVFLRA